MRKNVWRMGLFVMPVSMLTGCKAITFADKAFSILPYVAGIGAVALGVLAIHGMIKRAGIKEDTKTAIYKAKMNKKLEKVGGQLKESSAMTATEDSGEGSDFINKSKLTKFGDQEISGGGKVE